MNFLSLARLVGRLIATNPEQALPIIAGLVKLIRTSAAEIIKDLPPSPFKEWAEKNQAETQTAANLLAGVVEFLTSHPALLSLILQAVKR